MKTEWKNALYLYGIKGLQMLFPLFTFPYLARILSRNDFALVILTQSTAIFASLIIEYGFNYSATREIAMVAGNKKEEREIFSSVTFAKLVLSSISILATTIYGAFYSKPGINIIIPLAILTVSQGLLPIWYFQGTSNLKIPAVSEITCRLINFILMIVLIRSENQGLEYLTILSLTSFISSLLQNLSIFHSIGLGNVDFKDIVSTLKNGFALFMFRIGSSLYTSGSIVLLGNIVGANSFAIYAGADRIFRSAAALTGPLSDAFYPKISAAEHENPREARRLKFVASVVLIGFSILMYAVLYVFSEFWINLFLGSKYVDSIGIFRILIMDIPLIAIGTILGVFELLPKKLDLYFTLSVVIAGAWSLSSIYLIVPRFGLIWMAYTVVIAEILVIVTCIVGLIVHRRRYA